MRSLFYLLLVFPLGLFASTGPGSGVPLPHRSGAALDAAIAKALAWQPSDSELERAMTTEERLALSAAFAAPTAISERGDDLRKVAALSDSARVEIAKMRATLDKVRSGARQIKNLTEAALESLPLGIHQRVGNVDIHIAIAEARLTATQAEVDIYLGLDLPNTTQDPIFIARSVGWSRKGGFSGDIELELVADWGIDFNSGKSRLILKKTAGGRDGTFVAINCDGFVAGRLDATVLLSRDWVLPIVNGVVQTTLRDSSATSYAGTDRVRADFNIDLASKTGVLAEIKMNQGFVFTDKPDVKITIGTLAVDLSDAGNPTNMQFPENYRSPHVTDGNAVPTWQGFYLRALEVRLPEQYSRDGTSAITIGAPYLIVDRSGFTGHFIGNDVLPLREKTADGWAFSVDSFELKITQNTFEAAKLTGLINVPLLAGAADDCYETKPAGTPVPPVRSSDCLGYSAHIGPGTLDFSVRTQTMYCVNLWKADLTIRPNSRVDLSYSAGQFDVSATINGSISVDAEVATNVGFKIDNLKFDGLTLSNQSPHFSPGVWGFPDTTTARLKNFELSFTNISLTVDSTGGSDSRKSALNFTTRLNMDGEMKLNCTGLFKLTGELVETDNRQKWRFKKLKLRAFAVDASTDSWGIKATIAFYEHDDEWGTGFYGSGALRISALGGSSIAAVAQFGTFPNAGGVEEKYFFVDVMAKFRQGVPIVGGIRLMGIGGGIYKNMSRAQPIGQSFADPDDTNIVLASNGVQAAAASQSPFTGTIGISTSGTQYRVDLGNRFGAFLQVIIAGENEKAFSVNARLELNVNDDGGWRAALDGNMTVMGPVNFANDPKKTEGVGIFIHMSYVKSEEYSGFKATADVFVNIKNNTIVGGVPTANLAPGQAPPTPASDTAVQKREVFIDSSLGYAGNISLEFSTDRWYINIGYPVFRGSPEDKRIAMSMRILGAEVGVASYFCIGQNVPPVPPLPARVSSLTGQLDMSRDMAQYESASGFAFGTELTLYADGKFGIFYYDLAAGIGFDINVRNYGDAICAGDDPNGGGIGIDGWYAAGQAYAYVDADVGVKAPWWLGGFRVAILEAGVAAVLQLKAPNPVWGRGVIAGYYRVLGGLLKGRFRVESEFGDNCIVTGRDGGDPFANVKVLTTLLPDDDANTVPVNTTMLGYLTLPIGTPTELGDKEYTTHIIDVSLHNTSTDDNISGVLTNTVGATSLEFTPLDYLDSDTEYEISVELDVLRRTVGSRNWEHQPVKTETRTHTFRTGPAIDYLQQDNIDYSYPVAGQANFYRDEFPDGYLKVNRKQPNLTDNVTAVYLLRQGGRLTASVSWNDDNKRYEWSHPDLATGRPYRFQLVQNYVAPDISSGGNDNDLPGAPDDEGDLPGNIPNSGGQGGLGPDGGPSPFWWIDATNPSDSISDEPTNIVLTEFYFRTSQFPTFAAKLTGALGEPNTPTAVSSSRMILIVDGAEPFDSVEVYGGAFNQPPLISAKVTEDETYLDRFLRDNLYDNLPISVPSYFRRAAFWSSVDPDVPWTAVNLTPRLAPMTATQFNNSNLIDSEGGMKIKVDFPISVNEIATYISRQADSTIRALLPQLRIDAMEEAGGGSGSTILDCFPSILDRVNETGQYISYNEVMNDLLNYNGSQCALPRELVEVYLIHKDLRNTDFRGTTYPVEFRYRLPGGPQQPPLVYLFTRPE